VFRDKGWRTRPPLDLLHPYDSAKMKMTPANPDLHRETKPQFAGNFGL
jgi:hypothetical protein